MHGSLRWLSAFLLLLGAVDSPAQPANDSWANRTPVTKPFPFVVHEPDMYLATIDAANDPVPPCLVTVSPPQPAAYTLWYSYTTGPSTEYLTLTIPNNHLASPVISVYTGSPGAFRLVSGGCSVYSATGVARIAGLRLAANTEYSIEVATQQSPLSSASSLDFSVDDSALYTVTDTADVAGSVCGPDCSLRQAISASNAALGAVLIPEGTYTLTIPGINEKNNATGSLDARNGMGIYGAGMQKTIIDANHEDIALALDQDSPLNTRNSFAIGDLTITNGNNSVPVGGSGGGGVLMNTSSEYLGLERVAIVSNIAAGDAGGLYVTSPMTLRECVVSNNSSGGVAGGIWVAADALHSVEITDSTISGNSAGVDSFYSDGGGIYAYADLLVSNSTISGNHSGGYGGGINIIGTGALQMANSTVAFNSAEENSLGQFVANGGGGIRLTGSNPSTITNSIVALNVVAKPGEPPDCVLSGSTMTTSYNIVGSNGGSCTFTGAGDAAGTDPGISPRLAGNGGPTPTHALLSASPAIDAGDPAGCHDAFGALLLTDQRGVPRPQGPQCDIGAFEFQNLIFHNGFEQ